MPGGGFIDLTIIGADGVLLLQRRIATFEARITDHTEPLTQIGEDLLKSNMDNILSGGGEFAGGWEPLAPSTIERKRGPGPLIESGEMMLSLTQRGAPGNVFIVTPNSLEVGSTNPKAGYHQRGHSTPTRLPQRRVVGWSWTMRQQVVRRFGEYVTKILNQG